MKKSSLVKASVAFSMLFVAVGISAAAEASSVSMHRLYNPNSGEHFYTQNGIEKDGLQKAGWKYEGVGWKAPTSGVPVYRLYNPNAGDHHYTLDGNEKNHLQKVGWKYEGVGWYSDSKKKVPLYRAYNPNAKAGSHNYTVNKNEQNLLLKAGWRDEGIAWYGTDGSSTPTPTPTPSVNKSNLNSLINKVKGTKKGIYTDSSWSNFQSKLAEAQKVNAAAGSSQKSVDNALKALQTAFDNLKEQYFTVTTKHVTESGKVLDSATSSAKKNSSFKANAKSFSGYEVTGAKSQTKVITSNTTITFVYKEVKGQCSVTVNYVDENGYGILEPTTLKVNKGSSYTATAKDIDSYRVRGERTQTKVINSDTDFTFTYDYMNKVNVRHVNLEGRDLVTPEQFEAKHMDSFTANAKSIDGYVVDGAASKSEVINYDGKEITFTYLRKTKVTVNHVAIGSNQILKTETVDGVETKSLTLNHAALQDQGYVVFGAAVQIITPNFDQTVTFKYRLISDVVEKVRQDTFNKLNEHRVANGRQVLTQVPELNAGADIRAKELQDFPELGHQRPDGSEFVTVANEVGYNNVLYTENGGWDRGQNAELIYNSGGAGRVSSWSYSSGHNQNMLISRLTEAGIGINIKVNDSGTINVSYVFLGGYR